MQRPLTKQHEHQVTSLRRLHERFSLEILTDHIQVIETGRRHSSVYSGLDDHSKLDARRGSVDPALATTIFVQTHPSPAAREILDLSAPSSPVKSVVSQSQPNPSVASHSQAPSTVEAGGQTSPSTRASSLDNDASEPPKADTYTTHQNRSEDFQFLKQDPANAFGGRKVQTMSVYGPDVLSKVAAGSPGKNSSTSQMTASRSPNAQRALSSGGGGTGRIPSSASDDGERTSPSEFPQRPDLRTTRSQSRLRGLKFWKKDKAAKGLGVETP